jgi:hypothetical protein
MKSAFVSTHQVEQEIKSEKQISDAGMGYRAAQSSTENSLRINIKIYMMLGFYPSVRLISL